MTAETPVIIPLQLEDYLKQVREQNRDVQVAIRRVKAAEKARAEARLGFAPIAQVGTSYSDDKTTGTNGIQSPGDKTQAFNQSFGVTKDWAFGVNTSATHTLTRLDIEGIAALTQPVWVNSLDLEIRANLWRNLMGMEKWSAYRSQLRNLEAAEASAQFALDELLANAEVAYWNTAFAQQQTQSLEASLARAQGILAWNEKRRKLNLVDKGDVLQSKAAVLGLEQSLESAKRSEKEARRLLEFFVSKSLDGIEFDQGMGLEELSLDLDSIQIPQDWNVDDRADLVALKKSAEASIQAAKSADSALNPALDVFAKYGGKSADTSFSGAEEQTFDNSFRSYEVGVSLSVPLFVTNLLDGKKGRDYEAEIGRLNAVQAEYRLQKNFRDAQDRLHDLIERATIAKSLATTQEEKLKNEDRRFKQGRSSSFQILTFQEDLAEADLSLLRLYALIRQEVASFRLYGVDPLSQAAGEETQAQ